MNIMDSSKMKTLRVNKGFSQEILALKANLSTNFIGNIERGKDNITLESLAQIASALEVEPVTLIKSKLETTAHDFLWKDSNDRDRMYQQLQYMLETFDLAEFTTVYLNVKLVFDSKSGGCRW